MSKHVPMWINDMYRIVGNLRGLQFSWMSNLITFRCSIFADAHDRAITSMYKQAYFMGLIFAVHESTVKTAKISRYTVCHARDAKKSTYLYMDYPI